METVVTTIPIMAQEPDGATHGEVGEEEGVVGQHTDGQLGDLRPREVRERGQPLGSVVPPADNLLFIFVVICIVPKFT
jgi:hypothetical protein